MIRSTNDLELADEIFESIHSLMHLYRAQQYRALRDGPHDLTHMENKVLGFFAREQGATLSDLVQHSRRDKAQLARLIKGLRDKGLLEGEADVSDRRSVRLRLTEAARAVHQALEKQTRYVNGLAVEDFSEAECRMLAELIGRVRANLTRAS